MKNPDNPYNDLLVDMVGNVNTEAIRTISLNFGYTALNYGADRIRKKEKELGCTIPWLLVFDFRCEEKSSLSFEQVSCLITDAVSLGIYTFVFQIDHAKTGLKILLDLCRAYPECSFFAALSADTLQGEAAQQAVAARNLVVTVDALDTDEEKWNAAFRLLHDAGCFYGFFARYTPENSQMLLSDSFLRRMIESGCRIGGYICGDRSNRALQEQMYHDVCAKRGKKGEPLFTFDFYRDIDYVGTAIGCGGALLVDAAVDGFGSRLNGATLSEFLKSTKSTGKSE